jgi:hypothetical protein
VGLHIYPFPQLPFIAHAVLFVAYSVDRILDVTLNTKELAALAHRS